jgi:serine/threonine-protein kinase
MPELGSQIAGYRIESVLGRGGMSVVYLAEQVHLARKVALKLLSPSLAADENFRERFLRESRLAAAIDHPNIIEIYDAGEANEFLYIAMRCVDGYDLRKLIEQEGRLGLGRTIFLLEQVANALDAAHERDLVHRDVKPGNILIAQATDRVFLSDFGVVKHSGSTGLTRTGYFLGTVDYSAPEQIEGRPVDARTDVYAVGCVLYECLTGAAPFKKGNDVAVMSGHLSDPPPKLTDARPDLPTALNRVVTTAMSKAKEDRYASCGELIAALRAGALSQPPSASRVQLPGEAAPPLQPVAETVASTSVSPGPPAGAPPPPSATGPPASQEPPPPAAATVPAAPSGERRGGGRRARLALLAAGLVAVGGGGAIAGVLLTRGSGSNAATITAGDSGTMRSTTGHSGGTTAMAMGKHSGSNEEQLMSAIPAPIAPTCTRDTKLPAGAVAGQFCDINKTKAGGAEKVRLYLFANEKRLRTSYDRLVRSSGVHSGRGECSAVSWGGEGTWVHGAKEMGGRRFCDFAKNGSKIVWTEDHSHILGMTVGGSHPEVFSWWHYWVHRFSLGH